MRKVYRNPIAVAREWQDALNRRTYSSRADLARELGVTRARITQILGLLDPAPEVVRTIAELGDPLPGPIVAERMLRPLLRLPVDRQMDGLQAICHLTIPSSLPQTTLPEVNRPDQSIVQGDASPVRGP
jgi:hypothetical protein